MFICRLAGRVGVLLLLNYLEELQQVPPSTGTTEGLLPLYSGLAGCAQGENRQQMLDNRLRLRKIKLIWPKCCENQL